MSIWGSPVLLPRGGVTVTGDPATVPAMGEDLETLSVALALTQSGSGTPSPSNIRPIAAYTGAAVTVIGPGEGETRTINASWLAEAGKECVGVVDVTGGSITPHRVYLELDGTEDWIQISASGSGYPYVRFVLPAQTWAATAAAVTCSHFEAVTVASSNKNIGIRVQVSNSTPYLFLRRTSNDTVANMTAWLAEQYTAGTPVQVAYSIAEANRTPISVTPHAVKTYAGQNTISADCGAVTLTTAGSKLRFIS